MSIGLDTPPEETSLGQRERLLEVRNLSIAFGTDSGVVRAVRDVDLKLDYGETLVILGESGCGKSVLAQALLGIVPPPGQMTGGKVVFEGQDMAAMSPRDLRRVRGARMSLIFQDALVSLNPRFTVERQISEVLREHGGLGRAEASEKVEALMEGVGIPNPAARKKAFAHQFSGGMRQRVLIAMAIAMDPQLVIADEPTTALDVTVQAQVLDLLMEKKRATGMGLILITHDLGVARQIADRIAVMYAGRIVETGPAADILTAPAHPYTAGLIRSTPHARHRGGRLQPIGGAPPDLRRDLSGCSFRPRCPLSDEPCAQEQPVLINVSEGRASACHFAAKVRLDG